MTTMLTCDETLHETISKMEAAVLAPVISGELKNWVQTVQQAAATFSTDWTRYLHTVLHVNYAEISREDPDLAPCVKNMIAADTQLLEEFAKFHENLHELGQRALRVGNHESKLEEHRESVEVAGIGIITRIKKQIATADTWLSEALLRDRGVGD